MKLWIDSVKEKPNDYDFWAKTYEEAVILLLSGSITVISIGEIDSRIAKWIDNKAHEGSLKSLQCFIHSVSITNGNAIFFHLQSAVIKWKEYK